MTYYDGSSQLQSLTVKSGEQAFDYVPVKDGQQFVGWYSDSALTAEFDFETAVAVYAARLAIDERLGPDFVKELYKINYGFIVDKLMRSARGFTLAGLAEAVKLCAETDYAMKSSSVDDTELLCDLLIKLAAVSAA